MDQARWRLITVLILFRVGSTAAAAPALACELGTVSKKYPKLKSLFTANENLRVAAQKSDASFDELVIQAKSLEDKANGVLEDIQSVGCHLKDGPQKNNFAGCLNFVYWSCEAIPVSTYLDFLVNVKKTREQAVVYQLQPETAEGRRLETFMFKSINFFDVCCADSGCAQDGVGIPNLLYNEKAVEAMVELASIKGKYGNRMLGTLENSAKNLQKSKCSCHVPAQETLAAIVKDMKAAQRKIGQENARQRQINVLMDSMISRLSKGLPSSKCQIPGAK